MGRKISVIALLLLCSTILLSGLSRAAKKEVCIKCHERRTPGLVADWRASKHSMEGVTCSDCHGTKHKSPKNFHLAQLPDEHVCAQCHEEQFNQFVLPALIEESDFLDRSVYHYDGATALQHFDAVTSIASLDGIQWTLSLIHI